MNRGRPFNPGNKFGRGRPRGSRNKKSPLAHELLSSHADSILRKAVIMALQGNQQMMRTLLSHILQRTTGPLKTGPLAASTAQELDQSFEIILRKACAGQITLSQAQELASLIDVRRRVIDTREHEARLEAVEQVLKDGKDGTDKCGN